MKMRRAFESLSRKKSCMMALENEIWYWVGAADPVKEVQLVEVGKESIDLTRFSIYMLIVRVLV